MEIAEVAEGTSSRVEIHFPSIGVRLQRVLQPLKSLGSPHRNQDIFCVFLCVSVSPKKQIDRTSESDPGSRADSRTRLRLPPIAGAMNLYPRGCLLCRLCTLQMFYFSPRLCVSAMNNLLLRVLRVSVVNSVSSAARMGPPGQMLRGGSYSRTRTSTAEIQKHHSR